MEEEPIKKIDNENVEVKEEIKEEVKEEVNNNIDDQKKKRSIGGIISKIIFTLLFLVVLFETIIGVLNMQKLDNDEEPIWYLSSKEETVEGKKQITYDLGLYVIVKTSDGKGSKTTLKPFFLK